MKAILPDHALRGVHIHTPKTGGSTLQRTYPHETVFVTGHAPWPQVKEHMDKTDPELWDRLFKFAFVRNPYDRHLSWFFGSAAESVFKNEMKAKPNDFEFYRTLFHRWMDPDSGEKHGGAGFKMTTRASYRPVIQLTDHALKLKVDYLARFERYADEVDYIFERLHIEPLQDVRTWSRNASYMRPKTGHYSWWYGGERGEWIKGIVTGLGAWELTHLNYTFEDHGDAGRP